MITGPMLSFFCNDTSTTEIYTLSLHVALPIWRGLPGVQVHRLAGDRRCGDGSPGCAEERRLRPEGVLRLRLRHRPGAHHHADARYSGHPQLLGQRPALPGAVLAPPVEPPPATFRVAFFPCKGEEGWQHGLRVRRGFGNEVVHSC